MPEITDRQQDIADARMYGDSAEAEILTELERLGVENDPYPDCCPDCKGELKAGSGFAGETVLYCDNKGCKGGIVWCDHEGAIRNVY